MSLTVGNFIYKNLYSFPFLTFIKFPKKYKIQKIFFNRILFFLVSPTNDEKAPWQLFAHVPNILLTFWSHNDAVFLEGSKLLYQIIFHISFKMIWSSSFEKSFRGEFCTEFTVLKNGVKNDYDQILVDSRYGQTNILWKFLTENFSSKYCVAYRLFII